MNSSRIRGWFLLLALAPGFPSQAVIVNDGSTTTNLAQIFNSSPLSQGSAVVSLQLGSCSTTNCALTAVQAGEANLFALRAAWYAKEVAPTGGVYTVSAAFQPADIANRNRGGVMGWLSLGASNGIVLQVVPEVEFDDPKSFRVSVVDFTADDGNDNESLAHLFDTNGSPATTNFASAWSEPGANYSATNFATFQLAFSAPTSGDLAALPNATAHVTATVFQGTETNGAPIQVSRMIELLTDLPLPPQGSHRIGYYAVWADINSSGSTIGYLDDLTATNVTAVSSEPAIPPTLSIALTNGAVQLSWPVDYTSYQLVSSPNLEPNSWTAVATMNNRYSTEATNSARFFRLLKP
jgi:hypothetical protein